MKNLTLLVYWVAGALFVAYLYTQKEPNTSGAGLNYGAFLLVGLGALALSGTKPVGGFPWPAFLLALLPALSIMLYGPGWQIALFWPAWLAFGASWLGGPVTLPIAIGKGGLGLVLAPAKLGARLLSPLLRGSTRQTWLLYGSAGLVLLVFGLLYANTSQVLTSAIPAFWTRLELHLDGEFWGSALLGGLLLALVLNPLRLKMVSDIEEAVLTLPFLKMLGPASGQEAAVTRVVLIGLIVLAGLPAAADLLALTGLLPNAATGDPAGQVHQSVALLMISCCLIALLAGLIFRHPDKQTQAPGVARLFFLFLATNVLLVLVTCLKNGAYIGYLGLTYKRIGVFAWLVLVVVGLALTALKVRKGLSFYWLLRCATWAAGLCLASYGTLPVDYWVRQSQMAAARPDLHYLVEELSGEEMIHFATSTQGRAYYHSLSSHDPDAAKAQLARLSIAFERHTKPQPWTGQSFAKHLAHLRVVEGQKPIGMP